MLRLLDHRRWGGLRAGPFIVAWVTHLVGCGPGGAALPYDGSVGDAAIRTDGGTSGTLELLDIEADVTLQALQRLDFSVRLTGATGAPLAGQRVHFGLEGMPRSASLTSLADDSDGDGIAMGGLVAGSESATFVLNISADGFAPVAVTVRVVTGGYGFLVVQVTDDPRRQIVQSVVRALDGDIDCEQALNRVTPTPSPTVGGRLTIPALRADRLHTIEALGIGAAETIVARGCIEDVQVDSEAGRTVEIGLNALPLWSEPPDTSYDIRIEITHTEDAALVDSILNTINDTFEAFTLPSRLVIEMRAQLMARGLQAPDVNPLEMTALSTELALVDGPLQPIAELLTQGGAMSRTFMVQGDLALVASAASNSVGASIGLRSVAVPVESSGTLVDLPVQLATDRVQVGASWSGATDTLEGLHFALPLSPAELATATAEALGRNSDTLTDSDLCRTFRRWVQNGQFRNLCDAGCVDDTCIEVGLDLIRPISLSNASTRSLELRGDVTAYDRNGDRQIDELSAEILSGTWEQSGVVTARFAGSASR